MPRRPDFDPVETVKGWMVSVPPAMTATGERLRRYFETEPKAKAFAASVRASHNSGIRGAMISATLALQAAEAERVLDGSGITIVEAARMAVAKLGGEANKETFKARYDRAIIGLEMQWSYRYALDMGSLPRWVPPWFMDMPCGAIDRPTMERALTQDHLLRRSTVDNRCRYLSAILGFRERHKKSSSIAILTPGQVGRCLRACQTPDERWTVAILFFAGIRPDAEFGEISRLEWEAFGEAEIYISGDVSKTPSDRHIPISDRLRRLIKGHPKEGVVMPPWWKKRWQRIRRVAGISDMIDVTRHTYCSNMLAAHGMDATQSAMGHVPMSQTTRRHYARAVTKAAGERYFR